MKLAAKKHFKPATVDDGDELFPNGIFVFNITKLLAYVDSMPGAFPPEDIIVSNLNDSPAMPNEETIATADLSKPILLAEISPGQFNVIDGNHRLEKARRANAKYILGKKIKPEVHSRFLTSVTSYLKYIEYWNEKERDC